MRQLILAAAVSGTALLTGYGTANAQVAIEIPGAGVYVGPGYYDDYDNYRYGGRRVYGYDRYDDGYRVSGRERHLDRTKCGRNAYWDGQACLPGRRP